MSDQASHAAQPAPNPVLKLLVELGPLIAFFIAWISAGLLWATGVLMVATVVSLIASKVLLGHISIPLIATAALVLFFGGLTLWFGDTVFIKLKPTIIYLLFAGVLIYGLYTQRPLLKLMFGQAFNLTEEGWRKLTLRWIGFFLAMAVLNEIARHVSENVWVYFKAWGVLPLTLMFAMAQIGLIKRHELKTDA